MNKIHQYVYEHYLCLVLGFTTTFTFRLHLNNSEQKDLKPVQYKICLTHNKFLVNQYREEHGKHVDLFM